MRRVLEPPCLRAIDARALADRLVASLESDETADIDAIDGMLLEAEAASPHLTPNIINPSRFQRFWRLRFYSQTLELPTVRIIEQLLRSYRGLFVDVGAHVGYFSILAVQSGASRVVAIEMHEPNWRLLRVNAPTAECVCAAAGIAEGLEDYFVGTGHSNHSLNLRNDTSQARLQTRIAPLDALIGALPQTPFVVKIDVQGHELDVINGFRRGLGTGLAHLVFEVERNTPGRPLDPVYVEAIDALIAARHLVFSIQDGKLVEITGADDDFLASLPASSNLLAIPAPCAAIAETALYRRAFENF